MRIDKPDYLKLMAIVAPALANLYATKDEQNKSVIDEDTPRVPNDLYVYYDFVADMFDDIRDKIVTKAEEYVGNGNILDTVYEAAARRVGGMPTRDDVLRTILMMKDKDDIVLLHNGIDCNNVEDKLIDCIVYDLMALYALKDNEVYHYFGEESAYGTQKRPTKSRNG